ncbi:MAG: SpoIIE family protein phosphatase [Anaeromyxobacter sp.]
MSLARPLPDLTARDLEPILAVASKLAAPFDLGTMLREVVAAAKQVLRADRVSVWLHDAATDELVLKLSGDLEAVRVPAGTGLVGSCARERRIVNVPDCYADPRFDPTMDRRTGYRTRCVLTLPLVDHEDVLVGVMQLLNKAGGVFDASDEALAGVLAAQCAVALQRVRMTEALLEGARMRQELELAREVQRGTLPAAMPEVAGYALAGAFDPATLTGGDTYDLAPLPGGRLLVVLADATGHGMGPALAVAQLQAMLRLAFRLGTDLETAFARVNDHLADTLPPDKFVTAFIGVLDPSAHRLRYHSGGQGPILVYRAATGACDVHGPTSFPLAAMPVTKLRPAPELELAPGDLLVLLSDGYLEHRNPEGEEFGQARVEVLLREHRGRPPEELARRLKEAVTAFARGAPQEDDMTAVLVQRAAPREATRLARELAALEGAFAFLGEAFRRQGIDPSLRAPVDFVFEELFTNMVKYGGGAEEVVLEVAPIPRGVEVTLLDRGVDRFDPTAAPDADVTLPAEARRPGGLGLHLIRRMVDGMTYAYREPERLGRTTFWKTLTTEGDAHAHGG